jgi:hypothetical protein
VGLNSILDSDSRSIRQTFSFLNLFIVISSIVLISGL